MTERVQGKVDLEAALGAALRALTVLDADALEELREFLEGNSASVERVRSAAEWMQLRSQQWILGHLLEGTGRRLEMLQRVSSFPELPGSYGGRTGRGVLFQRRTQFTSRESGSMREGFAKQPGAGKTAN